MRFEIKVVKVMVKTVKSILYTLLQTQLPHVWKCYCRKTIITSLICSKQNNCTPYTVKNVINVINYIEKQNTVFLYYTGLVIIHLCINRDFLWEMNLPYVTTIGGDCRKRKCLLGQHKAPADAVAILRLYYSTTLSTPCRPHCIAIIIYTIISIIN